MRLVAVLRQRAPLKNATHCTCPDSEWQFSGIVALTGVEGPVWEVATEMVMLVGAGPAPWQSCNKVWTMCASGGTLGGVLLWCV